MARAAANWVLAAAAIVATTRAYRYQTSMHVDFAANGSVLSGTPALRLSEGPMFATGDEVGFADKSSTIQLAFVATAATGGAELPLPLKLITFYVGPSVDITQIQPCCTTSLYAEGHCSVVGAPQLPAGSSDFAEFNSAVGAGVAVSPDVTTLRHGAVPMTPGGGGVVWRDRGVR